jgi:hypothetical protein
MRFGMLFGVSWVVLIFQKAFVTLLLSSSPRYHELIICLSLGLLVCAVSFISLLKNFLPTN